MSTFAKKATSAVAALSIVFSIVSPLAGVSASYTSLEAANKLATLGVIVDQSANPADYRLGDTISRREATKVMIQASDVMLDESCTGQFSDLSAPDWGCKYAESALAAGMVAANPTFRPDANVSKIEALKMAFQARDLERYESSDWRVGYVDAAVDMGLTEAFTDYDAPATRGQVFVWIAAAIDATMEDDEDDLDDLLCAILGTCEDDEDTVDPTDPTTPTDPIVVVGGDVMVSLNPMSASAQTVPNSGLVPFGKFDVTAGDSDASISAITLKREGLSMRQDIRRVYFERNGTRVSSRANVTVDNTVLLTFSPALVVRAGQTVTLDLVVELDGPATVGAEHRFAVLTASDVEANGNVQGTYPVRTATMRLGSYVVEAVTATVVNSAANTVNVGDTNVNFGEIRLQTVGDEDNIVKSVTFRNDGTGDAEASLSNLGLYSNGQLVSTMVEHNDRDITFSLNTEIENGRSENFQIRADVSGAERKTENYNFKVRYSTDITVVEKETGFSAPITLNPTNFVVSDVDVNGGDLILTRDTAYTLNRTVPANSTDVVLWAAKLNVTEAITIEDLKVTFDQLPTGGNLDEVQSFRLFVGGNNVASYTPTTSGTGFTFESSFTVSSSTEMRIEANFRNSIAGNIQIDTIDEDSFTEVRYVSNDELATIDGSANGVNVTIGNSTLLITRNDSLTPESIVAGARDVTLFGFAARANDVSDLRITSINPAVSLSDATLSNITNVRLFEGSTVISTRNNFDFSNIDVLIPKNTAKSFTIVADFNTNTTGNITLSINDEDEITVRDVETNNDLTGSTITGATGVQFDFVASAELDVTSNSGTRPSSIVTPSTTPVDVFTFDLESEFDNVGITDMYFTSTGTTLDMLNDVASATLTVGGRTITGAAVSDNVLYFSIGSSNPVTLSRDQLTSASVNLAFVDNDDRAPATLQLSIGSAGFTPVSGTANGIRAISESTGVELASGVITASGAVESQAHLLAQSKPVVSVNAGAVSNSVLYGFSVTADANGYVDLTEFDFAMPGISGVEYSNIELRINSTSGTTIGTFPNVASGATLTSNITLGTAYANGYRLSAGSTVNFFLTATVDDNGRTNSYTRNVKLNNIVFKDNSGNEINNASTFDNTGLEAANVSYTVTK